MSVLTAASLKACQGTTVARPGSPGLSSFCQVNLVDYAFTSVVTTQLSPGASEGSRQHGNDNETLGSGWKPGSADAGIADNDPATMNAPTSTAARRTDLRSKTSPQVPRQERDGVFQGRLPLFLH
jgi:hypothetical protein